MKNTALTLFALLLSTQSFATDGIELNAKTQDHNVRVKKYKGITSNHAISIKNVTGKENRYKYTYCLQVDNHNQCHYNFVTLKPNATFGERYGEYQHVSRDKAGTYPIIARTRIQDSINDTQVEDNAVLTVY